MKLEIEVMELRGGDIALRMKRIAGNGTDTETAYADAILDHLKTSFPVIAKKLGGKGLIGGESKSN